MLRKSLLLACTAAVAAAVEPLTYDRMVDMRARYSSYMARHGKAYSELETRQRFNTYLSNAQFAEAHNAHANSSFTLSSEGPWGDMTNDEYRTTVLMRKGSAARSAAGATATGTFAPNGTAPPAAWDWRTHANVVGKVKNQGSCGSCWAFSAVATMEGAFNLNKSATHSFSEQQVVDCTAGGANTCAIGGEMWQGIEYVATSGGIEAETDYPYKGTSGGGCKFDKTKVAATFSGYENVTSGDEVALKAATFEKPIISVGIDASSLWFQLYFGGVYDHSGCKNGIDDLDHGVAVVGYGTASNGKDYWIVRNSWGGSWGMKGYIEMVRNKGNQCGVATQGAYAVL